MSAKASLATVSCRISRRKMAKNSIMKPIMADKLPHKIRMARMRWYVDLSVLSWRSLSSRSVYSESAPILEDTRPTLSLMDAILDEMIVKSCLGREKANGWLMSAIK